MERPNFSTTESEITETTERLRKFGLQIDKIKMSNGGNDALASIITTIEGLIHEGELNLFNQLFSYYLLGQAYCTQKMISTDPSSAQFNNKLIWKEVFCYRKSLLLANEVYKKKLIALIPNALEFEYQSLVHLGNVYDHMGRFQDALESYRQAATVKPKDYMWEFNMGFALGGTHGYYEPRAERFVLAWAKALLAKYQSKPETSMSALELYARIKDWPTPDVSEDKKVAYSESEEDSYNRWVNENALRLNAYNDINPHSELSQDDSLYFNGVFTPKGEQEHWVRLFHMMNEIKQEYVSARYMLYYYFYKSGRPHNSDKDVKLADVYDLSNYSFYLESAKSAFRALYSLLDKIAFALNDYLDLGIPGAQVSFSKMWYENPKLKTIRPKILNYDTLISLAGLLFIRNDIFGGSESYLQAEETKVLNSVRNAMEHRAIIITDDGVMEDRGSVLFISRGEFENVAMNLIKTVRQAIFCFVNAVNHIEYDRKLSIQKDGGFIMPQEIDAVKDDEKI